MYVSVATFDVMQEADHSKPGRNAFDIIPTHRGMLSRCLCRLSPSCLGVPAATRLGEKLVSRFLLVSELTPGNLWKVCFILLPFILITSLGSSFSSAPSPQLHLPSSVSYAPAPRFVLLLRAIDTSTYYGRSLLIRTINGTGGTSTLRRSSDNPLANRAANGSQPW